MMAEGAATLEEDLAAILGGPSAGGAGRGARRHTAWLLSGAGAALLALGGTGLLWQGRTMQAEAPHADQRAVTVRLDAPPAMIAASPAERMVIAGRHALRAEQRHERSATRRGGAERHQRSVALARRSEGSRPAVQPLADAAVGAAQDARIVRAPAAGSATVPPAGGADEARQVTAPIAAPITPVADPPAREPSRRGATPSLESLDAMRQLRRQ